MGLILDSSAIIAGERKGQSAADVLSGILAMIGAEPEALSVISAIELEQGIWRARTVAQASARQKFMDDRFQAVPVYPLTFDIARLARGSGARLSERASRFRSRIW